MKRVTKQQLQYWCFKRKRKRERRKGRQTEKVEGSGRKRKRGEKRDGEKGRGREGQRKGGRERDRGREVRVEVRTEPGFEVSREKRGRGCERASGLEGEGGEKEGAREQEKESANEIE